MDAPKTKTPPRRRDGSVIIHFDYDCFYASVFEAENPALRFLPLAVQQKQIVVTCNYEARRRGLHKLQLITEAKRICPDVIIVLGEDLTRFRNASKELYSFIRSFSWNGKVERLGFDEVFLDVTDIVQFNVELLNRNDLENSFFCLSRQDLTAGFSFDASSVVDHTFSVYSDDSQDEALSLRLVVGSHLARHIRRELEYNKGYTSTVGISSSKLLSKLVGNLHKPNSQTTLMPPYVSQVPDRNNVRSFLDDHDVGKIPGIGFKMAQRIRAHVLERPAEFDDELVYGGTREKITVKDVRTHPDMTADVLEKLLAGPGAPHGIGLRVWHLLNGVDDAEVSPAREVPKQISIEDSYLRLDTHEQILKELHMLSLSLIKRMRTDLTGDDVDQAKVDEVDGSPSRRWLVFPRTLRLSTRPRPAQNPDGSRNRSFARISRSSQLPGFVFNLDEAPDKLATKLVHEALIPLFRKLHPERAGWNLSLVNVAVTDMIDAAGTNRAASGRDITKMFKYQNANLQSWKVKDQDIPPDSPGIDPDLRFTFPGVLDETNGRAEAVVNTFTGASYRNPAQKPVVASDPLGKVLSDHTQVFDTDYQGSEDLLPLSSQDTWVENGGDTDLDWGSENERASSSGMICDKCGAFMPSFAMLAHQRFHEMEIP